MIAAPAWLLSLLAALVETGARRLCEAGQDAEVDNRVTRAKARARRKARIAAPKEMP